MNRINVLSYIDDVYKKFPDKPAFVNEDETLTFSQLYNNVNSIGSFLQNKGLFCKPIVVFMKKSPSMLAAFFGVIAAGCYYVPIDTEMPHHRINLIFETLKPEMVICDDSTMASAEKLKEETKNWEANDENYGILCPDCTDEVKIMRSIKRNQKMSHCCVCCGCYIEQDNLQVCDKCASEYEF